MARKKDRVEPDPNSEGVAAARGQPVGIVKKRVCRDVIFLLLFIVYWIGMAIVAQTAVASGDPRRLIAPQDYIGQYCGYANTNANSTPYDLTAKPYLYYIDPITLTPGICVASCPATTAATLTPSTVVCVYNVTATVANLPTLMSSGVCSTYVYQSTPVLNRCIPTGTIPSSVTNGTNSTTAISVNNIMSTGRDSAAQAITDLYITWPIVAVFAAIALVICLIWLLLLQWFAGIFVWVIITATNVLLIGASIWLYYYWQAKLTAYNNAATTPTGNGDVTINMQTSIAQNEVTASMVAFYICAVLAGIMFLVTIAMIKRIRLAVQIIKEASKALMSMPTIIFFPAWIYSFMAALTIYFVVILLYLLSPSGPITISAIGRTFSDPKISQQMVWYHLIGYIWGFTFFSGINQISIAGAIADWYWTLDKKRRRHLPVIRSFCRVCLYHLGSVALGSLLLTIVEVIRIVLWYIMRQAKRTHNKTLQYFVACFQCCAKCLEVIMKFINKNAYIYIAITGKAFFKAAAESSSLLIRNALRLVAVDFVSDFILILSKIAVTVVAVFLSYIWINYKPDLYSNVKFPFVTVALVGVVAFMVATAFFSIYHLAIDTIFLSFLEDSERNDGSAERPFYMSDNLKRILGKPTSKKDKVEKSNVVVNNF